MSGFYLFKRLTWMPILWNTILGDSKQNKKPKIWHLNQQSPIHQGGLIPGLQSYPIARCGEIFSLDAHRIKDFIMMEIHVNLLHSEIIQKWIRFGVLSEMYWGRWWNHGYKSGL